MKCLKTLILLSACSLSAETYKVIDYVSGETQIIPLDEIVCESYVSLPEDALLAYYPLNGNGDDLTGTWNATNFGATSATDRNGVANGAMYFDGNSYLKADNVDWNGGTFTVSIWINSDDVPSWYRFAFSIHAGLTGYINKGDANISIIQGGINNIDGVYAENNGMEPSQNYQFGILTNNTWNHLVMVRSGNEKKAYLNGVLVDTKTDTQGTLSFQNGQIVIGAPNFWGGGNGWTSNGRNTAKFKGYIDDMRIYNVALAQAQVEALYAH